MSKHYKETFMGGDKGTTFRFMEKSYTDVMELLVLTRDYFAANGRRDRMMLKSEDKLLYTITMSNMTVQLSKALSWLMLQKAVHNGEITQEEATKTAVELPDIGEAPASLAKLKTILPVTAQHLLEKNHEIYMRVKRLSDNMRALTPNLQEA